MTKKIMLSCNAGMSTSMLVQKLQKTVADRGLDIEIVAYPMGQASSRLDDCDLILLGPQVSYLKDDWGKRTDTPISVIPMLDYGRMNADNIINDALKILGE